VPLTKKRTVPRTKKNYSITPTFVENAKRPSQSQKAFWYWDKKLTGFGLKVYYTGRKVYGIRFILKGGKSRWIEIGPDGDPWNAKTARDEATLIAQNVMNGRTPMAHKVEREGAGDSGPLATCAGHRGGCDGGLRGRYLSRPPRACHLSPPSGGQGTQRFSR